MRRLAFICLLIVALVFSCDTVDDSSFADDCVTGTGNIISQTFEVEDFDAISLEQAFDLSFSYDEEFSFVAIGHENIMQFLEVSVSNGELNPSLVGRNCFRDLELHFEVTAPSVNSFSNSGSADIIITRDAEITSVEANISGSGNIQFRDQLISDNIGFISSGSGDITGSFSCNSLATQINGSGDVMVEGSCQSQTLGISGSGSYQAFSLTSDTTTVSSNGSGDAEVSVTSLLEVSITGSGDVTYRGNPAIESSITGSGGLINGN